jgi:hypothetical protein
MLVSTVYASEACSDELATVQTKLDDGIYQGRKATTIQSNLDMKLAAAKTKLTYYKFDDAVEKLYDISEKATAWADADAPKAKLVDATAINDAVADAISCIGSL